MIKLNEIFANGMQAAVNYNDNNRDNMGIAFYENTQGINHAVISSRSHIIHISNVEKPPTNFYSYSDNEFTAYRYPVDMQTILSKLDIMQPNVGCIRVPVGNLINYVDKVLKTEKTFSPMESTALVATSTRSRFIFKSHQQKIEKGEIVINFKKTKDGVLEFRSEASQIPFLVAPTSTISNIDEGVYYKGRIVEVGGGRVLVDVLEKWGPVFCGYIYSPSGYTIDDGKKISPADALSYAFGAFEGDLNKFSEYHFDTGRFHAVVTAFRLLDPKSIVEIIFPENSGAPIRLCAGDQNGRIEALIIGLDKDKNYQWR